MKKISIKNIFRFGAAVLVGAAVFFGSKPLTKKANDEKANGNKGNNAMPNDGSNQQQTNNMYGPPRPLSMIDESSESVKNIQDTIFKTSQIMSIIMNVLEGINRLFTPTVRAYPYSRYSTSTIIL